ncbi:MAG: hypothetical protein GYA58_03390 [Anaerolineaceae bacterium]|nr:hypothetical protein [Anaerolineaceae bacterium]
METAIVTGPSLADVRTRLRERKQPSLLTATNLLSDMHFVITCGRILAEMDQAAFSKAAANFGRLLDRNDTDLIRGALLESIYEIAPIDIDYMESLALDNDVYYLIPEPLGYPMGWDEWEELVEDLQDTSDGLAMYVFFTLLRFGEFERLEQAIERWGWNFTVPIIGDSEGFDWERFDRTLQMRGLGCFSLACDVCCYQSGNLYFDFNLYDENAGDWGLPPFNVDGIRALAKEYQQAIEIQSALREADRRFLQEPGLAGQIFEVYLQCLIKKARVKVTSSARTLMDIWAGETTAKEEGNVTNHL